MATGIRKAGDFCWINILTADPAGAMAFFGGVLGWDYAEMPFLGHTIKVGGHAIGGLYDLHGHDWPVNFPTIGVMIKVDDADAIVEKVVELGGKAQPAFDIGDKGRMSGCHDPAGGAFDIWEPINHPRTEVDSALPGAPSWSECLTTDAPRSTAFYTGLFGWSATVNSMPGMDYTVFRNGDADIAGMMPVPEPAIPTHWGTYFTVADVERAARVAQELGGTLFVPPMDIPKIGRFCGILTPQGVRFYAIQYLPLQAS